MNYYRGGPQADDGHPEFIPEMKVMIITTISFRHDALFNK